jgi:hypothetical protein
MLFLLEPRGFDDIMPFHISCHLIDRIDQRRDAPPKQGQPPVGAELANLDDTGLYLLHYHRPGSSNPSMGIAFDHAF